MAMLNSTLFSGSKSELPFLNQAFHFTFVVPKESSLTRPAFPSFSVVSSSNLKTPSFNQSNIQLEINVCTTYVHELS